MLHKNLIQNLLINIQEKNLSGQFLIKNGTVYRVIFQLFVVPMTLRNNIAAFSPGTVVPGYCPTSCGIIRNHRRKKKKD